MMMDMNNRDNKYAMDAQDSYDTRQVKRIIIIIYTYLYTKSLSITNMSTPKAFYKVFFTKATFNNMHP